MLSDSGSSNRLLVGLPVPENKDDMLIQNIGIVYPTRRNMLEGLNLQLSVRCLQTFHGCFFKVVDFKDLDLKANKDAKFCVAIFG
jgi:hypothetical protein